MNVLFFCRADRTRLMAHLAESLRAGGVLDGACAYVAYYDEWRDWLAGPGRGAGFSAVYGTREIFERLDEPPDPERIAAIEWEYGQGFVELWSLIYSEWTCGRHTHPRPVHAPPLSRERMLRYLQLCVDQAEEIFDRHGFGAVVDFAPVSIVRGALAMVAARRGAPYLHPFSALFRDWHLLHERPLERHTALRERYEALRNSGGDCAEGREHLGWFRSKDVKSSYSGHQLDRKSYPRSFSLAKELNWWARQLLLGPVSEARTRMRMKSDPARRNNFHSYKSLCSSVLHDRARKALIKADLRLRPPFAQGPPAGKYAFFTLHMQPEVTTSLYAPFFTDQYAVVDNISKALPLDWTLVVKPNPVMIGVEPSSFYRRMNAVPNVTVVSPEADTRELILGSQAMVTISGTSGFEAALHGRKVIAFCQWPPWTMLEGVSVLTDFTRLHDEFRAAETYRADDGDLAAYLQALSELSFPMDKKRFLWRCTFDRKDPDYAEFLALLTGVLAERLVDVPGGRTPKPGERSRAAVREEERTGDAPESETGSSDSARDMSYGDGPEGSAESRAVPETAAGRSAKESV